MDLATDIPCNRTSKLPADQFPGYFQLACCKLQHPHISGGGLYANETPTTSTQHDAQQLANMLYLLLFNARQGFGY